MTDRKKETQRAYLAPLPRLPLARQQRMASEAGCGAVYGVTTKRGKDIGERRDFALWVSSLRPGDTAWVPDLRVLVPAQATRPGRELAVAVATVLARGAVLVDGTHGARSDSKDWPEQYDAALRRLHQGRRDPVKQRELAAVASKAAVTANAASGIIKEWSSATYAAKRKAMLPHWRDLAHKSDEAAREALADPDLQSLSTASLRRIFGPRRDGRLHYGGRPPAKRK